MTTSAQAAIADLIYVRTPPAELRSYAEQALERFWQTATLRSLDTGAGGRFRNTGFAHGPHRRLWLDQPGRYLVDIQEGIRGTQSWVLRVTFYDRPQLRSVEVTYFKSTPPALYQPATTKLYASQQLLELAVASLEQELTSSMTSEELSAQVTSTVEETIDQLYDSRSAANEVQSLDEPTEPGWYWSSESRGDIRTIIVVDTEFRLTLSSHMPGGKWHGSAVSYYQSGPHYALHMGRTPGAWWVSDRSGNAVAEVESAIAARIVDTLASLAALAPLS